MDFEQQTQRLILKILTPDYLREVLEFQMRNKELFEQFEPERPEKFYTFSHQHDILKCEYKLALKLQTVRFYVFMKNDPHTIIGTVCLHDIIRSAYCCCEIGYKFDTAWQHMGYAKESLSAILNVAFRDLSLHRVLARVVPNNQPSIRLLESLDFMLEGLEHESIQIQGKWTDHLRYAKLCPSL